MKDSQSVPLGYLHLVPGRSPPSSDCMCPFKAVVVIEQDATQEWRSEICDWLVCSGCRYAMTWGVRCGEWHFAIDHASLQRLNYEEVPDSDFVMTTDHDKESLEEAFWFAAHVAMHPSLDLEQTYIVHIASSERSGDMLRSFREAQKEISTNET